MTAPASAEDIALYAEIETLAVELAHEAGDTVARALEAELTVEYKTDQRGNENSHDPVSEVDRSVEALVNERIGARFPGHAVLGEESETHPDPDTEYVWVIDPVDGTTNFVNGFPLFAVSIGVLRHGQPVAGAIWCATTHALRPGVYHAHAGGPLCLDGVEVARKDREVKRKLAAAPGGATGGTREWDHRITGSMAIEGAYVAAGIFTSSTFWTGRLWDVAATVLLVQAAGGEAWLYEKNQWTPFARFEPPARLPANVKEERAPSLRDWRLPLIVGTPEAIVLLRQRVRAPGAVTRMKRRARRWWRDRRPA